MNTPATADVRSPAGYVSIILAVLALIIAGADWFAHPATDLRPLQSDVADLKSQVEQLTSGQAAASQAASGAQGTANQALAAAQAAQSAVDATNEKINRMFKSSLGSQQ